MHEKQEKLINSFNAKLLAVRKVTQETQGKKNCRSWRNKKTQWNEASRTCEKNSNRQTIPKDTTSMNRKTWEGRKKTIRNSKN